MNALGVTYVYFDPFLECCLSWGEGWGVNTICKIEVPPSIRILSAILVALFLAGVSCAAEQRKSGS
jgi:hypothetical protein